LLDKRDRADQVTSVSRWLQRERALSCALLGVIVFVLGYLCGHLDERLHFALDVVALGAFAAAAFLERQAAPRMVWILLLVACVIFAQMDFRLSSALSQPRSEGAFEAR